MTCLMPLGCQKEIKTPQNNQLRPTEA